MPKGGDNEMFIGAYRPDVQSGMVPISLDAPTGPSTANRPRRPASSNGISHEPPRDPTPGKFLLNVDSAPRIAFQSTMLGGRPFLVPDGTGTGFTKDGHPLLTPREAPHYINFETRSKRPPEWDNYIKTDAKGEKRFDLENPKVKEALAYVDRSYQTFQVDPSPVLEVIRRTHGRKSIDEVRERLMNGQPLAGDDPEELAEMQRLGLWMAPMMGNRLLPLYKYHQPNIGKGHYAFNRFNWDSFWDATWAVEQNDPDFAHGLLKDSENYYRRLKYEPNSNAVKTWNRTQAFLQPLMQMELDELEPIESLDPEQNAMRNNTVAFLKSMLLNVWFDDPEGKAQYDTYAWSPKKPTQIWLNQALTPTGLPRYASADIVEDEYAASAATGEDDNPRFGGKPYNFNTTDLTGYVGIALKFFYQEAKRKGDVEEAHHWKKTWQRVGRIANEKMWNEEKGFYYDYDFVHDRQSDVMALAAFTLTAAGFDDLEEGIEAPMFTLGRTTSAIAGEKNDLFSQNREPSSKMKSMADKLKKFTLSYGLATTSGEEPKDPEKKIQWQYPLRWSPKQHFAWVSLWQYPEMHPMLEDLVIRSMIGDTEYQATYGTMAETLDAKTGELGQQAMYPRTNPVKLPDGTLDHEGFMWTLVQYKQGYNILNTIYAHQDTLRVDGQPEANQRDMPVLSSAPVTDVVVLASHQ